MDPFVDMCRPPRFLPLPLTVEGKYTNVISILWISLDDGRIYKDCEKCNGKICGRGANRPSLVAKL